VLKAKDTAMAKAINWPLAFRDEVISEDCEAERCAFRLGRLYYEHRYWVPGEIVDIRVNHLKVRKAEITRELKLCRIRELGPEDLGCQKKSLQSIPAVVQYLVDTYNQPVDPEAEITIVYYRNLPINPQEMEVADDPHL
jgi:hypothetical protein